MITDEEFDALRKKYKDAVDDEMLHQYVAWMNYEIGFTGNGTSLLDIKPEFDKPVLPEELVLALSDVFNAESEFRRKAWRDSVLEVTGEDIDDLGIEAEDV